jgi:hypothetical protein
MGFVSTFHVTRVKDVNQAKPLLAFNTRYSLCIITARQTSIMNPVLYVSLSLTRDDFCVENLWLPPVAKSLSTRPLSHPWDECASYGEGSMQEQIQYVCVLKM